MRIPPEDDFSYELLERLAKEPHASQRSIATRLGVSVGKVNYCLRALMDKGWVKARNFQRSDNKWAYSYLLTPTGAAAKVRLARAFLRRKLDEFERLRYEIEALRHELKEPADVQPRPRAAAAAGEDARPM